MMVNMSPKWRTGEARRS